MQRTYIHSYMYHPLLYRFFCYFAFTLSYILVLMLIMPCNPTTYIRQGRHTPYIGGRPPAVVLCH